MTPSSVSFRCLPEAVVSVDDSVVCLTPSSRSVHLLCETVASLAPSSLSLHRLSRSVFSLDPEYECDLIVFCLVIGIALPLIGMIGVVWKRQWSVSFIPEPTRVSQKDSTSSKPEDRCCVEEAMECFIHSGTHASLSEGFNLIKARGRL
ncbi:hypothetical protein F2Q69_00048233 [Brassica cretica]|uniref:Uncharacterized protein n=1 Tax=Brassica cretica TaxID=69181 RepID=A0A8S9PPF5_BRACR|nr:hypothetical protein F2Q69_00048233 [Brassica cretica]